MNDNMLTPEKKEIYTSTIEDERSTIYLDHNGEVVEIERHDNLTDRELAEILIPDVSTKPLSDEEVDRILEAESK